MRRKRNIVYSSADDDFEARPPEQPKIVSRSQPAAQQTIAIQHEKKGRGGKQVTVLRFGVMDGAADLAEVAAQANAMLKDGLG